jgi:hypothetical protein
MRKAGIPPSHWPFAVVLVTGENVPGGVSDKAAHDDVIEQFDVQDSKLIVPAHVPVTETDTELYPLVCKTAQPVVVLVHVAPPAAVRLAAPVRGNTPLICWPWTAIVASPMSANRTIA